jgi:hypothetical protein
MSHLTTKKKKKQTKKKHCPCIMDGRLSTNAILSALHHQGPKPNMYVRFRLVHTFKERSFQNKSLVSQGKRMGTLNLML